MDGSTGNPLTEGIRSSIITSVERETTQLRQFPLVGSELAAIGTYFTGHWRSLVARPVWGGKVKGSNPLCPTCQYKNRHT